MNKLDAIQCTAPNYADELFLCAASFEDRCTGALSRFQDYKANLSVIVDFKSRHRNTRCDAKRKANLVDLMGMLEEKRVGPSPIVLVVDPYNPLELSMAIERALTSQDIPLGGGAVTIDITCFTKIQLLFLMRLLQSKIGYGSIRLLYTTPSHYGSLQHREAATGYDQLLVVPFCRKRGVSREIPDLSMIILLGHEGTRSMHAWVELEPHATTLVRAMSETDPAIMKTTEQKNKLLMSRAKYGAPEYQILSCPTFDIAKGIDLYREVLENQVTKLGRTVAFVPMGPKPLVAAFALAACSDDTATVDIAYPVPHSYDPDYSTGVGSSYSFVWQNRPSRKAAKGSLSRDLGLQKSLPLSAG